MKTTLKTAKFTFKTAFARCVAAKILCENGEMYAVFGGFMIDCGMFCRGCGDFYVLFRWLRCLFAVKMRCGNGEMVVRLRRLVVWLRWFSCLVSLWFSGWCGVRKFVNFNFFNSIRRFFFAECRFAVNYAKYKELSKALSIRAFGVSESENAVFRMEKRRIRGEKTPFSPSKNAVFLFKNAVFSRKNGVFQPGVFDFVLKSAVFRFSDGETCVKFRRKGGFTFLFCG